MGEVLYENIRVAMAFLLLLIVLLSFLKIMYKKRKSESSSNPYNFTIGRLYYYISGKLSKSKALSVGVLVFLL